MIDSSNRLVNRADFQLRRSGVTNDLGNVAGSREAAQSVGKLLTLDVSSRRSDDGLNEHARGAMIERALHRRQCAGLPTNEKQYLRIDRRLLNRHYILQICRETFADRSRFHAMSPISFAEIRATLAGFLRVNIAQIPLRPLSVVRCAARRFPGR